MSLVSFDQNPFFLGQFIISSLLFDMILFSSSVYFMILIKSHFLFWCFCLFAWFFNFQFKVGIFFISLSACWRVFHSVWSVVLWFFSHSITTFLGRRHGSPAGNFWFSFLLHFVLCFHSNFLFMLVLIRWILLVSLHFQARSVGMEWFMRLLVQDYLFCVNRKIWFIYLATRWVEEWNDPMSLDISILFCFTES